MASNSATFEILFLVLLLSLSQLSNLSNCYESGNDGGFTIELIHRDSPHSPLYDPLSSSFHRSLSHNHHSHRSSAEPTTPVIPHENSYLAKFYIGNPPVENLVFIDTGSQITWIQCKPCKQCYKQIPPIFEPKQSSTYKKIPCKSSYCQKLPGIVGCLNTSNVCQYALSYLDNSTGQGDMSTDTFTFGSSNSHPVAVPKLAFGCGHINGGPGFEGKVTGIWGLTDNPFNLVTQMGFNKFSYCFTPVDGNATSKLKVGSHAAISGNAKASIPYSNADGFYSVSLQGISLGKKMLGKVNLEMIIDSGTTVTLIPPKLYAVLESEIKKSIKSKPVKSPGGSFTLCYSEISNVKVPPLTFHFTGGDVTLPKENIFRGDETIQCLAVLPADDQYFLFGCLVQLNYQVEYDLKMKMISFAPSDCTKF